MSLLQQRLQLVAFACMAAVCGAAAQAPPVASRTIVSGWQMQEASMVPAQGKALSRVNYQPVQWYTATVPGTALTTLVNNHVYPEPLYGGNNRPEVIPDSLASKSFWYRTVVMVPIAYRGRHTWIHFEGINYASHIWVNGKEAGQTRGAFLRGVFDVSGAVTPGKLVAIAVLVESQPHPGVPHEHTLQAGMGRNGGVTAIDGPTFLSTIGWDWIPAIRDRDTGIWREVYLSQTGGVRLLDPYVSTDVALPGLRTADVAVKATVENITNEPQTGVLSGGFEGVQFEREITLAPHAVQTLAFEPQNTPSMHLHAPRLWWPNGYGPQNLYKLHLSFAQHGATSDTKDLSFGIRKITYTLPNGLDALAFVVNGQPIFIRGGNWGLDDAMKRIPYERLDAQIRMHKLANLNMIRNWVGQSTSEDFYELCDKYGLLVWDEFFQPNPNDGPDPTDLPTYLANVQDKVLRFRNHPSIALWCARNEGNPPSQIDAALKTMLSTLDPPRLYQANSSDGRGIRSHGPYRWRAPREYYWLAESFKSETGSMSIPTIESVQGMLPQKDWEVITDDWAEHDFTKGAASGELYPDIIRARYGEIVNLADFVRKSQLANYEAFRAMFEGRNAEMFRTQTGIMTWMSHPAQPSFVWQLYHYDLEPNSALFAVKSAAEPIHVQFNEVLGTVQVINNGSTSVSGAKVHLTMYNVDGSMASEQDFPVTAQANSVFDAGAVQFHEPLTTVHFIDLHLTDASGNLLSRNFYWHTLPERADQFRTLEDMPKVTLHASIAREDRDRRSLITVKLVNPSTNIALMVHLQMHKGDNGDRVLPAFPSDNYVTLVGGESRTITIEAETALLGKAPVTVLVDGWNVDVAAAKGDGVTLALNQNAQVSHWPRTGLPFQTVGLR